MERPSQAPAGTTLVELKLMLALAAPSAVLNVCRMGQMVTDQAVIGHLSVNGHATPVYLDAAALALLWMTLTLTIVNRGLNQTINMLVSQALGAGNYQLGDTWLLTGVLIAVPTACRRRSMAVHLANRQPVCAQSEPRRANARCQWLCLLRR